MMKSCVVGGNASTKWSRWLNSKAPFVPSWATTTGGSDPAAARWCTIGVTS